MRSDERRERVPIDVDAIDLSALHTSRLVLILADHGSRNRAVEALWPEHVRPSGARSPFSPEAVAYLDGLTQRACVLGEAAARELDLRIPPRSKP